MKKLIAYIILFTVLTTSCDSVPEIKSDNYVIEAYVFAGQPVRDVTIKTLVPLNDPDGDSDVIETARVEITKEGKSYSLIYNPITGKYQYQGTELQIEPLDQLDLQVDVNGRLATATTQTPTLPEGLQLSKGQMVIPKINSGADFLTGDPLADAEIIANWSNAATELHYTVIEFRGTVLEPILPPDVQEVVDGILEDFAIITLPTIDTTLIINGALLPSYGRYVVKLHKVNQEYADLYNSETQDSRDLNQPPSNIINARGIFSAFATDSIFFEVVLE